MQVHHYHEITREYMGSSAAMEDPMEPGRWLVPAWATLIEPPAAEEGKVRVFDGTAWSLIDA